MFCIEIDGFDVNSKSDINSLMGIIESTHNRKENYFINIKFTLFNRRYRLRYSEYINLSYNSTKIKNPEQIKKELYDIYDLLNFSKDLFFLQTDTIGWYRPRSKLISDNKNNTMTRIINNIKKLDNIDITEEDKELFWKIIKNKCFFNKSINYINFYKYNKTEIVFDSPYSYREVLVSDLYNFDVDPLIKYMKVKNKNIFNQTYSKLIEKTINQI
jgi:hypothetical protein